MKNENENIELISLIKEKRNLKNDVSNINYSKSSNSAEDQTKKV